MHLLQVLTRVGGVFNVVPRLDVATLSDAMGTKSSLRIVAGGVAAPAQTAAPYKCDVCFKTFTMKHNLVSHMKRHQGIFPYHCTVCGKGVYSRGDKMTHMLTNHPDHPHTKTEQENNQAGLVDQFLSKKHTPESTKK